MLLTRTTLLGKTWFCNLYISACTRPSRSFSILEHKNKRTPALRTACVIFPYCLVFTFFYFRRTLLRPHHQHQKHILSTHLRPHRSAISPLLAILLWVYLYCLLYPLQRLRFAKKSHKKRNRPARNHWRAAHDTSHNHVHRNTSNFWHCISFHSLQVCILIRHHCICRRISGKQTTLGAIAQEIII